MNPPSNTKAALRYYRKKSAVFKALGLTTRGQSRRRRIYTAEERRFRNAEKFRIRTKRMHALGLTSRGTAPKRKSLTPMEAQWREFKLAITK